MEGGKAFWPKWGWQFDNITQTILVLLLQKQSSNHGRSVGSTTSGFLDTRIYDIEVKFIPWNSLRRLCGKWKFEDGNVRRETYWKSTCLVRTDKDERLIVSIVLRHRSTTWQIKIQYSIKRFNIDSIWSVSQSYMPKWVSFIWYWKRNKNCLR